MLHRRQSMLPLAASVNRGIVGFENFYPEDQQPLNDQDVCCRGILINQLLTGLVGFPRDR